MSSGSSSSEETLVGDETLGGSRPRGRPTSLTRGSTVGRYVVLQQLGVGGMGVVHAAYDPELDRAVALKVLVPREGEVADEVSSQRLLREAQAMARLSHPNVVAVHDVGMHESRVFVAMELVEGQTLTQWLQAEQRSPQQILQIFVQAGRGLAAAHAKGLVHRDFKPDNVMVGQGDGSPRAQVMDFGLARAAETDAAAPATVTGDGEDDEDGGADPLRPPSLSFANDLTRVGQVVGTPRFMAAEQHLRGEVDARTDQYAFCVALWLALFDQHPFGGGTATELVARVVAGEVVEPPAVAGVGARLRKALRAGLSPEREQRWPSMDALLDELERDPSRARKRVIAGVGVLAVVAGLLGGERLLHARAVTACEEAGTAIDQTLGADARAPAREGLLATQAPQAETTWTQLGPWLDRYQEGWAAARTESCLAAEVDGQWEPERYAAATECLDAQRREVAGLLTVLAQADRNTLFQAIPIAADLPPPSLCTDPRYLAYQAPESTDPAVRQEQRAVHDDLSRARFLMRADRLDDARAVIDEVAPRLEAMDAGPLQVDAARLRAWLHEVDVHWDEAIAGYRDAFAQALSLGTVHQARELAFDLARVTGQHQGDFETATWWLDVADALTERIGRAEDSAAMLRSLHDRAMLASDQGDHQRALELAQRALAEAERTLGPRHPDLANDTTIIAMSNRELGNYALAIEQARRAVELSEDALGPLHPNVLSAIEALGETLRQTGEADEALTVNERALEISQQIYPPGHPAIATTHSNMSLMLQEVGRIEEALPHSKRAIEILEANGTEHPNLVLSLINLGNAQQTLEQLDDATETYHRAIEIAAAHGKDSDRARAIALVNLGNTEHLAGHSEDALTHLRQAQAILEQEDGPEHARVGITLINIAEVQADTKRHDEAIVSFERALAIIEKAHGPDHPDVAYPLLGIASVELDRGRPERAVPLAERAVAIREAKTVGPGPLALGWWTLAQALEARGDAGDHDRAIALARKVLPTFEKHAGPQGVQDVRAFLGEPPRQDG